ncbi:ABC transporter substrate-binding protein [Allostreptomyces psammosilenae]|uniref:Multiple sugar transport system substrate-binding protein n=1 Tax=Allostreptomyces psammosilenae TaxID=1892865 RepID=A0A852ZSZ8_9ACTN|nr:extracellular solute-binding protein [Allostreptomyces psammosilenae]NYI03934.1 multiple sugar transport system substrate-binding protein [Allostreptomyces psammosilenae]
MPSRHRARRAAAGAGIAVSMLLATGCGGGDGGSGGGVEIRYSWWGNAERAELMQQAIDLFEERNPTIDVQPTFSSFESYWQKIATEAAGGGTPDVMQMDVQYLREYSDKNVLADLGQGPAGETIRTDGLRPGLEESGVIDGARYAVPASSNVYSMVYEPAAFEAAGLPDPAEGWTWDQYHEAYATMADTDVKAGPGYSGVLYVLELQLRQEGSALYTEDGQLAVSRERVRRFLQEGKDKLDADQLVDPGIAEQISPESPLTQRLIASEFAWDNFLVRYSAETDAELALAAPPTTDPGGPSGLYMKPGVMLSMSANSDHPEEAAALIDFLINDPEAGAILGSVRGIPATEAQLEAADLKGHDLAVAEYEQRVADVLGETPPMPPAGAGAVELALARANEDISYGTLSVDEAVDRFFTEAEEALAD